MLKEAVNAVRNIFGPVLGTPEFLAVPGNIERMEKRLNDAAESNARTAIVAFLTAAVVPETLLTIAKKAAILQGYDESDWTNRDQAWRDKFIHSARWTIDAMYVLQNDEKL